MDVAPESRTVADYLLSNCSGEATGGHQSSARLEDGRSPTPASLSSRVLGIGKGARYSFTKVALRAEVSIH